MVESQSMRENKPDLVIHPRDFPLVLRTRMIGEGMNAVDYAAKLGVSVKLIYALLNGQRTPSDSILKKLGGEVYYGFTVAKAKK